MKNAYVADTRNGMVQTIAAEMGKPVDAVDWVPPPTSVRWLKDTPFQNRRIYWDTLSERLYAIDEKKDEVLVMKGDKVVQTLKVAEWTPVSVKVDLQGTAWVVDRSKRPQIVRCRVQAAFVPFCQWYARFRRSIKTPSDFLPVKSKSIVVIPISASSLGRRPFEQPESDAA